ncbi:hypothetical protein GGX14DRAFT_491444 [Mycena pura]|uniref:Uncharacterized protein n=1 Tax=Mycena pura TaxID=153505 RepID=A0AAD6YPA4_9AGAR|nr:hypothetical protein GGX14DRAFT_491444 [Mycena pura]
MLSEILAPLLKHPDEVFSDRSEKVLLEPGYSSATYLLVCKTWFRVATPLLYNVVILRTSAQSEAIQTVLKAHPEIGSFIKKLRVEGGFGDAMHTILKSAPNITDLFLTLSIWGSGNVRGLCSGLPLINPRRVIIDDDEKRPKKNKFVTELFETLIELIPKWDRLQTFDSPYTPGHHPTSTARAEALASALRESRTLQTLIVGIGIGDEFPHYLYQVVNMPSLKRLHFEQRQSFALNMHLRAEVEANPKLKAIVTFSMPTLEPSEMIWETLSKFTSAFFPSLPLPALEQSRTSFAGNFKEFKRLSETEEGTAEKLEVLLPVINRKKPVNPVNPMLLAPFTSVTDFTWRAHDPRLLFTPIPAGFSPFSNLEILSIGGASPTVLDFGSQLPLASLRKVHLCETADIPASIAFLQSHGAKLVELTAPLDILAKIDVFNLSPNLNLLVIVAPSDENSPVVLDDFFTCSNPHPTLSSLRFDILPLPRKLEPAIQRAFERLEPQSFPLLKEMSMICIEWPTSQHGKNKWIILSEVLRPKGIKLTDMHGIGGTGKRKL